MDKPEVVTPPSGGQKTNAPTCAQNQGVSTPGIFSATRLHARLDVTEGPAIGTETPKENPPGEKVPEQLCLSHSAL